MTAKREEFCSFTQGKMAVDAYSREFRNLARYATEEVSTDAKKQARFRKGLNPPSCVVISTCIIAIHSRLL